MEGGVEAVGGRGVVEGGVETGLRVGVWFALVEGGAEEQGVGGGTVGGGEGNREVGRVGAGRHVGEVGT